MLKKAIVYAVVACMFYTGLSAEEKTDGTPEDPLESYSYIEAGFSNITFLEQDHLGLDLGIGVENYTEEGFYYGHVLQLNLYRFDKETAYGFHADLKGGMRPMSYLTIYGLVGFAAQAIPNLTTPDLSKYDVYMAPGLGGGVIYKIPELFKKAPHALDVAFRFYRLKHQAVDPEYNDMYKLTATFKYSF